jgi:hypothetical protein
MLSSAPPEFLIIGYLLALKNFPAETQRRREKVFRNDSLLRAFLLLAQCHGVRGTPYKAARGRQFAAICSIQLNKLSMGVRLRYCFVGQAFMPSIYIPSPHPSP